VKPKVSQGSQFYATLAGDLCQPRSLLLQLLIALGEEIDFKKRKANKIYKANGGPSENLFKRKKRFLNRG
jgi:hypothetical protein